MSGASFAIILEQLESFKLLVLKFKVRNVMFDSFSISLIDNTGEYFIGSLSFTLTITLDFLMVLLGQQELELITIEMFLIELELKIKVQIFKEVFIHLK